MKSCRYKASAPGSLMLFGEHAVLNGYPAIATAVNYYIHVELEPTFGRNIKIISSEFDEYIANIDKFEIIKPYNYVLTAIKQYITKINHGFILHIKSEFPSNIGFGSSAAVTSATLGVLALWLDGKSPDLMKLHKQVVTVIRSVSGVGSGTDAAASIFGGVIAYQMKPVKINKLLNANLPLICIYSGYKTPTYAVIVEVEKKRAKFKAIFANLFNSMGMCTKDAITAIKKNDLVKLGVLMNINQGLQDAIGTNDAVLSELIFALRANKNIYGAKISGSGLGDCVVGLGKINSVQKKSGVKYIDVASVATGFSVNSVNDAREGFILHEKKLNGTYT